MDSRGGLAVDQRHDALSDRREDGRAEAADPDRVGAGNGGLDGREVRGGWQEHLYDDR